MDYGFLLQVTGGATGGDNVPPPASPIATAPALRFAGWSPDNRWLAYWASSQEHVNDALGHFVTTTLQSRENRVFRKLSSVFQGLPQ